MYTLVLQGDNRTIFWFIYTCQHQRNCFNYKSLKREIVFEIISAMTILLRKYTQAGLPTYKHYYTQHKSYCKLCTKQNAFIVQGHYSRTCNKMKTVKCTRKAAVIIITKTHLIGIVRKISSYLQACTVVWPLEYA